MTTPNEVQTALSELRADVRTDSMHRMLFAQDASVYSIEPLGVAFPRTTEEVQEIVSTATARNFSIVPRAAGTSLAGQTVGPGLIVDTGRYMNSILDFNADERWVRVQPGVILEDLNRFLAPHGLFFGPDTSTANRCMIGGMIGNNSCGTHSILYGNTMQHVAELGVVFSDGKFERVGAWGEQRREAAAARDDRLGAGIRTLDAIVSENAALIREAYPREDVIRRNTGYPLDDVLRRSPYQEDGEPFSLARFLCGTEGTLGIVTEAKLTLVEQPRERLVVCAHFDSLSEALESTVLAIKHNPSAVELIDDRILEQTRHNLEQRRNRFFLEGEPRALLIIEFYRDTQDELDTASSTLIEELKSNQMGYAFPIVRPPDDSRVWSLRKAGLGLLMGIPGDTKPVSVVEDTAVPVEQLPAYISEFRELMKRYETESVYHAHASVGELHLRPELNLKDPKDVRKFVDIARDTTDLVKTYRGSLSGEHGDGRVRSPLIERFYGSEVYQFHRRVKEAFDPNYTLNPGVIIDPAPMDENFRSPPDTQEVEVETLFDWSASGGLMRAVEKCNGAGACRKPAEAGGTMCPSYMVTREEKDSTRGRANVFRHLLRERAAVAMESETLKEVMDLCLSCKGCKSECPANVDMARMKAEFTQHYHDRHGRDFSAWFFGHFSTLAGLASIWPAAANFTMRFSPTRWLLGRLLNLAPGRDLPAFTGRFSKQLGALPSAPIQASETVWLYVDPFSEFVDAPIAHDVVRVLHALGVSTERLPIEDDGRTLLSKGLVREASTLTNSNLQRLKPLFENYPDRKIVGIEPSSLLTFRDETPDLARSEHKLTARSLADRSMLFDEFLCDRLDRLDFSVFDASPARVLLHGHCHQKAIVGTGPTTKILEAAGYTVESINSGCCGMAGSFGYEANHYELSMKVGELVLFPRLRESAEEVLIAAPGTSCRHQIADGVGRTALHPATLLARKLSQDSAAPPVDNSV